MKSLTSQATNNVCGIQQFMWNTTTYVEYHNACGKQQ